MNKSRIESKLGVKSETSAWTQQVSKILKPPVLPRSSFQSRAERVIPSTPNSESDYDCAVCTVTVGNSKVKEVQVQTGESGSWLMTCGVVASAFDTLQRNCDGPEP